ncbi:MAG: hypothetical protein WDZ69_01545 [Candidatus Pacearchaeota archaeon]
MEYKTITENLSEGIMIVPALVMSSIVMSRIARENRYKETERFLSEFSIDELEQVTSNREDAGLTSKILRSFSREELDAGTVEDYIPTGLEYNTAKGILDTRYFCKRVEDITSN